MEKYWEGFAQVFDHKQVISDEPVYPTYNSYSTNLAKLLLILSVKTINFFEKRGLAAQIWIFQNFNDNI
jgi:hypothetical protein